MERIGIFGGTFNPPHTGHIHAVVESAKLLGLDRVILIPSGVTPGKQMPAHSPEPWQRLEMLRLAAQGQPGLEVADIELQREGQSYTYDTLCILKEQYPDAELVLMIGTDMFLCIHTWHRSEELLKLASIAVMLRGDKGEKKGCIAKKAEVEALGGTVTLLKNPVEQISSTQLRRLLAFGAADSFLHPDVSAYIHEHGFYDTDANWKNLPMEELEAVVIRLLNPNRVAHVLGCRDTAVALARRWGANEEDAARAGILHDITKALDGPLQLTLCQAYGKILSDFSKKYPRTLHALTGSLVAERIFGENAAVVAAICHHTTGKADMSLLETIIYVADYMEPNRDFPGVEQLRELAFSDIRAALKLGLEMTLEHLNHQGNEVSPESREALAWLNDAGCQTI